MLIYEELVLKHSFLMIHSISYSVLTICKDAAGVAGIFSLCLCLFLFSGTSFVNFVEYMKQVHVIIFKFEIPVSPCNKFADLIDSILVVLAFLA